MSENKQAFTGFAGLADANGEWNKLQFAIRQIVNRLATTAVVLVTAVEETAEGFTVDVQPMVSQVDGAGNAVPHGTIHNLPVWRVQGGTSGVIVKPAAGDIGVAVFASTDISGVKRAKEPTTPGSGRRFDWADGIYLGGILNVLPTQLIRMDDDGITITSLGAVTINAPAGATVNGDATVNGNASVDGDVSATGNLNVSGNGTFGGNISGNFS